IVTPDSLGLNNIHYVTPATNMSNVGAYFISPSMDPLDLSIPAQAALGLQYDYVFNDGILNVLRRPLEISPHDTTLTYGDKVGGFTFNYDYDETGISVNDRAEFLNNLAEQHTTPIDSGLALIDG